MLPQAFVSALATHTLSLEVLGLRAGYYERYAAPSRQRSVELSNSEYTAQGIAEQASRESTRRCRASSREWFYSTARAARLREFAML